MGNHRVRPEDRFVAWRNPARAGGYAEEEESYLAAAAAAPLLREVATLLVDTGVRPDELHRMTWEHITWANGRHGAIMVLKGKSGPRAA